MSTSKKKRPSRAIPQVLHGAIVARFKAVDPATGKPYTSRAVAAWLKTAHDVTASHVAVLRIHAAATEHGDALIVEALRAEQRDAAAALDAASDRGQLAAARVSFARYLRLSTDARATAWWLAQRGGAVRAGAYVLLAEWADVYGRLDGPRSVAERAERATVLAAAADTKLRALKHRAATGRFSEGLAREIDDARAAEEQARTVKGLAREELRTWALGRFEALWDEWRGA